MAKTLKSVQNGAYPYKIFLPQNKKRTKTTRDTMYSAMSSIPSGGPPGETHTQELWYSLRGIDARLESVLSTCKCLCDACCARSQPLILFFFFSSCFGAKIFCTDQHHFVRTINPKHTWQGNASTKARLRSTKTTTETKNTYEKTTRRREYLSLSPESRV